jgi:RNA ligase
MGQKHYARTIPYDQLEDELAVEIANGNVSVVRDGPLALYRYTDQCAFDKKWTPASLIARGLILDTENRRVVATPFPKFFNYGEGQAPNAPAEPLPDEPFEVTDKVDGSLGVIFWDGRWRVATRGSFTSNQAKWAEQWLSRIDTSELWPGDTYLAEIVFADNRIVIHYDFQGLVLLSAYDGYGEEFSRGRLLALGKRTNWPVVGNKEGSSIGDLLAIAKTLPADVEGFVVRFESGRRIKIKGDEYCRIHRLISRVTPLAVFEMLVEGDDIEAVKRQLPEEFHGDIDMIRILLHDRFRSIVNEIRAADLAVKHMNDKDLGLWLKDQLDVRQDIARWIFPCRKKNLLACIDVPGHELRRKVFDLIRPTNNRLDGYVPSSSVNRFAAEVRA